MQKFVILSVDAMVGEDALYLMEKPNFSRLFAKGACAGSVRTVYPSVTYPVHASIMTGCRPGKTGIYANFRDNLNPPPHPDWHLDRDAIRVETWFDAAKRAGLTTASVYWPTTGNDPHIDWEINELFFYENEDPETLFRANGANDEAIAVVKENLPRWPDRTIKGVPVRSCGFDDFIMGCVCSLIRRDKPDLLTAHNCILDSMRHRYGVFHENVAAGLDLVDEWLGEVIEAAEDAGTFADTNFIVLSDHGQRGYTRKIHLGSLLRRGGFLELDADGKIASWRARPVSNGLSSYIVLADPKDEALKKEVADFLAECAQNGEGGFSRVLTAEELDAQYGLRGNFSFMLETDGETYFVRDFAEPLVEQVDLADPGVRRASHGYDPETGAQPVFFASGPAFRPGAFVPRIDAIDEAPTVVQIMGQTLPEAEGRVLTELLNL